MQSRLFSCRKASLALLQRHFRPLHTSTKHSRFSNLTFTTSLQHPHFLMKNPFTFQKITNTPHLTAKFQFHTTSPTHISPRPRPNTGLGTKKTTTHGLGANPKPANFVPSDPWGKKAKEQRLQAEMDALAGKGEKVDRYFGMSEIEKEKYIEYEKEVQELSWFFNAFDKLISTPFFYLSIYIIPTVSAIGLVYYVGMKLFGDLDDEVYEHKSKLQKALKNPETVKPDRYAQELKRQLQLDATADEIAELAMKHKAPEYVKTIEGAKHGSVDGLVKGFNPPPAQSWDGRRPIIQAYVNSGITYADYTGRGHFHIYHNGRDHISEILDKIKAANPGMPFTWQILSPEQVHIALRSVTPLGGVQEPTFYGLTKGTSIPKGHIKKEKKRIEEENAVREKELADQEEAKFQARLAQEELKKSKILQLSQDEETHFQSIADKKRLIEETLETVDTQEYKTAHDQQLKKQQEELAAAKAKFLEEQRLFEQMQAQLKEKMEEHQKQVDLFEKQSNEEDKQE